MSSLQLLNEKRLSYVGAMILGMNDAIVEITGTLAGLTLAMQNTRLIALSGLITRRCGDAFHGRERVSGRA